MTMLAAGLALLAAALFAVANVAQQRSAAKVPDDAARGLGLIRVLVRRPLWWAGIVGDTGGFVAQAAALGVGSLLLVQPLLVTTLLFALPLGARWAGRRLAARDAAWAVTLAAALAAFVVIGDPSPGVARAPWTAWWPTALAFGVVFAVCALAATRARGTRRAVLLAACTAIAYGLTAALTKATVDRIDDGIPALLATWELYALVVAAVGGTLLQQSAFQAGELGASLPTITVGEPVVAAVVGAAVLGEDVRDGALPAVLALGLIAAVATVALARSSARTGVPAR